MTKEEAILCIKGIKNLGHDMFTEQKDFQECLDMAIKALEQEPRKDEVILTKEEYGELVSSEFDNGYAKGYREALEQEPKLEKDGTLIITTEHYENVNRVLVQHGINGTLFYQDQEPCDGTQTAEAESTLGKVEDELYDLADSDAYGDYQQGFNFGLMRAAQIIDKYKAESEGK
jgi:hypothetical protein